MTSHPPTARTAIETLRDHGPLALRSTDDTIIAALCAISDQLNHLLEQNRNRTPTTPQPQNQN